MFLSNFQDSGSSILPWLVFSPMAGVFALMFVDAKHTTAARVVGQFSAFVSFVLSLFVLQRFQNGTSEMQLAFQRPWVESLGVTFALGIDGISIWLVVLTTFLTFLVLCSSESIHKKMRSYLACTLLLEVGILGSLLALDAVVFYVFWELMLIPMYFLIGIWGGANRFYAAIKFVLFTAFGSLLMLVAIVYLGLEYGRQFGAPSFFIGDWMKLSLTSREELYLFAAFALAFAIKVPVFPLHTWLPDAHVEAPTGGSVMLAGILLKLGIYGLIRFGMPVFPHAFVAAAPLMIALGVIGIVFGACVAWVQTDMKKLVAYSSVSHLGFCVMGLGSLTSAGMEGSMLQLINHGISTAALFFLVGVLYDRKHTRQIVDYQGLASKVPIFAGVFLIFSLSSIGLPLTNGFIGEFLTLYGVFQVQPVWAAVAVSGVILGALYMLSLYRRVVFGPFNADKNSDLEDLTLRESMVFFPLIIFVFIVGIFPQGILVRSQASANAMLALVRAEAPAGGPVSEPARYAPAKREELSTHRADLAITSKPIYGTEQIIDTAVTDGAMPLARERT